MKLKKLISQSRQYITTKNISVLNISLLNNKQINTKDVSRGEN